MDCRGNSSGDKGRSLGRVLVRELVTGAGESTCKCDGEGAGDGGARESVGEEN